MDIYLLQAMSILGGGRIYIIQIIFQKARYKSFFSKVGKQIIFQKVPKEIQKLPVQIFVLKSVITNCFLERTYRQIFFSRKYLDTIDEEGERKLFNQLFDEKKVSSAFFGVQCHKLKWRCQMSHVILHDQVLLAKNSI